MLWAAMKSHINETDVYLTTNFIDIMTAWTEQKGFPVVQAVKAQNSSVILSQVSLTLYLVFS